MADTKYRLDRGVQQTLAAVLPSLAAEVDGWSAQVEAGEVDEQFRQVAVALGWITQRDSRVHPVGRQTTPSTVRPARRRREASPEALPETAEPQSEGG